MFFKYKLTKRPASLRGLVMIMCIQARISNAHGEQL